VSVHHHRASARRWSAGSLIAIEPDDFDEHYDPETLARIERRRRPAPRPTTASRARSRSAALAIASGIALGLREVFDPPERAEIEAVDPWQDDLAVRGPIRFRWHDEPVRSVVEVDESVELGQRRAAAPAEEGAA
jgi:hypothetical protein